MTSNWTPETICIYLGIAIDSWVITFHVELEILKQYRCKQKVDADAKM